MEITFVSNGELLARRAAALDRLGMDLATARGQWSECGCCLAGDNYDDLIDLELVKDADYLLNEPLN